MKKIGFVDYYISEWHANNYPAWIAEVCSNAGAEMALAYAWAEMDISPLDGRSTDEWCNAMGVVRCNTIEELCEKSDYIIILSPSNPEKHLQYAKATLPYGKLTYIDKTFAARLDEAREMYELADRYGAKIFSTSALRYADELELCEAPVSVDTVGAGSRFEEYIIHQCEMIVKKLGVGAESLVASKTEKGIFVEIKYNDERRASMLYSPTLSFSVSFRDRSGATYSSGINSPFFNSLMQDIVSFFESGEPSFPREETFEVIALVEAAIYAEAHLGETVKIGSLS